MNTSFNTNTLHFLTLTIKIHILNLIVTITLKQTNNVFIISTKLPQCSTTNHHTKQHRDHKLDSQPSSFLYSLKQQFEHLISFPPKQNHLHSNARLHLLFRFTRAPQLYQWPPLSHFVRIAPNNNGNISNVTHIINTDQQLHLTSLSTTLLFSLDPSLTNAAAIFLHFAEPTLESFTFIFVNFV